MGILQSLPSIRPTVLVLVDQDTLIFLPYDQTGDLWMDSMGQIPLDFFESAGICDGGRYQMCPRYYCYKVSF